MAACHPAWSPLPELDWKRCTQFDWVDPPCPKPQQPTPNPLQTGADRQHQQSNGTRRVRSFAYCPKFVIHLKLRPGRVCARPRVNKAARHHISPKSCPSTFELACSPSQSYAFARRKHAHTQTQNAHLRTQRNAEACNQQHQQPTSTTANENRMGVTV